MSKNHSPAPLHRVAPGGDAVQNEKAGDKIMTERRAQNEKSAQHNYAVQDKRREARIEHTNGSTPRRDL